MDKEKSFKSAMETYFNMCASSADELFDIVRGKKIAIAWPAIARLLLDNFEETQESKELAKQLAERLNSQRHSGGSFMATLQMLLHKA